MIENKTKTLPFDKAGFRGLIETCKKFKFSVGMKKGIDSFITYLIFFVAYVLVGFFVVFDDSPVIYIASMLLLGFTVSIILNFSLRFSKKF